MKLFPTNDDLVLYKTGFEDDFLGRKKLSKQLSELVEKIEDPIVVALDDEWGNGKTYFLKRWVGAHETENDGTATTVYFDAFEHDYLSDPLLSIISAISDRLPEEQRAAFEVAKTLGARLARPALMAALSAITFGAKQHLDDMGDAIADALSGEAKDFASGIWSAEQERKDAVQDFRERLAELTSGGAPALVVVVDELDRCRPDYALSVLEIIKHFFSVPNVHFVLGVNGSALESSVRARYGSGINAERYLRKFINLSFSLPRVVDRRNSVSVLSKYARKLIGEMGLQRDFAEHCVELIACVADGRKIALRDVEKILSKVALLPQQDKLPTFLSGWIDIICVMTVSSVIDPDLHTKFLAGTASNKEIRNFLNAPESVTLESSDEGRNRNYDHQRSLWFYTTHYCCGAETLENTDRVPSWLNEIGTRFDRFGHEGDPKQIPASIQSDFVDLFRLND